MAKIIASVEFEKEVLKSSVPVMVDFFATWCGPCKMIAPAIDEISAELEGKAKVIKIDVDNDKDLAKSYDVKSIPTLVFFKNGQIEDKIVGAVPKEDIVAKLNGIL